MNPPAPRKEYLKGGRLPPPNPLHTLMLSALGLGLRPLYGMLARRKGALGMAVRSESFDLGLQLLFRRKAPIDLKTIFFLLCYPMDSTRYFELDFLHERIPSGTTGTALDVSSPRLGFTLLLGKLAGLHWELINPDASDMEETRRMIEAAGLASECHLHSCLIDEAPFEPASMDVVTCISVLEHIPDDAGAVRKMWELLKPGGKFILTVPCAKEHSEQYMNQSEYGVLKPGEDGHVFWQRFYDEALLKDRIFKTTGAPALMRIFGEKEPGALQANAREKRTQRYYPFWRECYMVARDYQMFDSIRSLPGEGVCAMEFVKR